MREKPAPNAVRSGLADGNYDNNRRYFYIDKSLRNLDKLRGVGFQANRRLLKIEKIYDDCILTEEQLHQSNHSQQIGQ